LKNFLELARENLFSMEEPVAPSSERLRGLIKANFNKFRDFLVTNGVDDLSRDDQETYIFEYMSEIFPNCE